MTDQPPEKRSITEQEGRAWLEADAERKAIKDKTWSVKI